MNVVFCSCEVYPFAKTGGLGDVCGSLPLVLEKFGFTVSIVLPAFVGISKAGVSIEPLDDHVSRAIIGDNIHVYFIEHAGYFGREGFYGNKDGDYPDNLTRFQYYCSQTLGLLKKVDFKPDIIHCHDWQTALIPVLIKEKHGDDLFYQNAKTVMTIHNLAFQGVFPKDQFVQLGLDNRLFSPDAFEFYDQVNLLKAGIVYADLVTTVSSQYAREIQTKEFGCGLENVLKGKKGGIIGILNGLDTAVWEPATDPHIAQNFSAEDFEDAKLTNKLQLQKQLNLEARDDVPLLGFVGRLSHQKGIDLILDVMEDLMGMDVQLVILGVGDGECQQQLVKMAALYPDNVAVCFDFQESLGHKIYAGSDLFLMPSRFEPCGLSQMISLHYGTIPIVFHTGGLVDTIHPFGALHKKGNGFVFAQYTAPAFLSVIRKAVKLFGQEEKFSEVRRNALRSEFTWEQSSHCYQEIYRRLVSNY